MASRGACQERGWSVPEGAGTCQHVKLQTKGGNGTLLYSDRHDSLGELRIAKEQTSAGKGANAGRYPFRVKASWYCIRTARGQEVFSPIRVSNL